MVFILRLMCPCCLIAFNSHFRIHNEQLSKWDVHGEKQLLGGITRFEENIVWLSILGPIPPKLVLMPKQNQFKKYTLWDSGRKRENENKKRQEMKYGVTEREGERESGGNKDWEAETKWKCAKMCFQYNRGGHSDDESSLSIGLNKL